MGLQQAKLESLPFVTAELNYLAPTPGKPRTYAFDPPPGEPKSTALPEPHNVPIFDARLIAGNLSLWTAKALRWSAIPPSSRISTTTRK